MLSRDESVDETARTLYTSFSMSWADVLPVLTLFV